MSLTFCFTQLALAVPLMAAYALFALGIVLIYRASRVLNLAHGVMAMLPAYVVVELRALRRRPAARDVPLVAMSASDSALELAKRTGDFDAFVRKPFEHDALVSLVQRYARMAS